MMMMMMNSIVCILQVLELRIYKIQVFALRAYVLL